MKVLVPKTIIWLLEERQKEGAAPRWLDFFRIRMIRWGARMV